jgi:hypothetical protein
MDLRMEKSTCSLRSAMGYGFMVFKGEIGDLYEQKEKVN